VANRNAAVGASISLHGVLTVLSLIPEKCYKINARVRRVERERSLR